METIKIAHLYYDLMNLYGENGNVKALANHFEHHKVKVITHFLSIDDEIDFTKYDLFYIGSGNRENFHIVREDILKHQSEIKEAIKNNKMFFITGNGLDLFGKSYTDLLEKEYKTLNVLNYESYETDFRIVGEANVTNDSVKENLIGFQNRFSVIKHVEEPYLFQIIEGTGHMPKSTEEGICKNMFYATYLLGPILIRNPHFTEYIVKQLLIKKEIIYQPFIEEYETKAYEEYLKNWINNN